MFQALEHAGETGDIKIFDDRGKPDDSDDRSHLNGTRLKGADNFLDTKELSLGINVYT